MNNVKDYYDEYYGDTSLTARDISDTYYGGAYYSEIFSAYYDEYCDVYYNEATDTYYGDY